MYKKIFVINIIIYMYLQHSNFYEFKIVVFLFLRERVCSPFEFAPLGSLYLLLEEFVSLRIFCRLVFT